MLTIPAHTAIIGGGPGGLTLARLLQQRGFNVTVYERDETPDARQQGATLDLHEDSGLKALKAAGLIDEFLKHYRPGADKIKVTDETATVLFSDHDEPGEEDISSPYFRPEIDRGPLRNILVNSLKPSTVQWDSQFMTMGKSDGKWRLRFRNGNIVDADLVIAADGANSKIRPLLCDIKPIYSGITIVEGNIYHAGKNAPILNEMVQGGKIFAMGGEKSIILSAKGEGSLSFYTGTKEAADWLTTCSINFNDKNSVLNWFRERFSDWPALWEELFASDEMYIIPRPMFHYPADQSWPAQPDLTMLGDAAHRMPPYAGEGVNMAMLDALELADSLGNPAMNTVHEAIAAYEVQMRQRAGEVTTFTLEQTEWIHASGAAQKMAAMFAEPGE